jgi:hypothetical protein
MDTWSILRSFVIPILWTFGIGHGNLVYIFPVLVFCTKKNMATLFFWLVMLAGKRACSGKRTRAMVSYDIRRFGLDHGYLDRQRRPNLYMEVSNSSLLYICMYGFIRTHNMHKNSGANPTTFEFTTTYNASL